MSDEKCPKCGVQGPILSHKSVETLAGLGEMQAQVAKVERAATGRPPPPHLPNGPACLRAQLAQAKEEIKRLEDIAEERQRLLVAVDGVIRLGARDWEKHTGNSSPALWKEIRCITETAEAGARAPS